MNRLSLAFALFAANLEPSPAQAQPREKVARNDAALVVEGVVRQVFRSARQGQTDFLVQVEVQRSEGRRPVKGPARPSFPSPGESVYIHVFQRPESGTGNSFAAPPSERSQIRTFLMPRDSGGWEGTFPDWFEMTAERPVETSAADPAPSVPESPTGRSAFGLTAETLSVSGRNALRVTSVERGGVAQRAGLEVGDVIVAAKGNPVASLDQLDALVRGGESFSLNVLDVNTGRATPVEVKLTGPAPKPSPDENRPPAEEPTSSRSLGLTADPVTVGQRTALKVTRIDPAGAAAKAGIELGDVLVAANSAALTSPEQLAAALRKSGSTMTLTVRDVRTGREAQVPVKFAEPASGDPAPPPPAAPGGGGGKLGAVTEISFFDTEIAVKVTEVDPGSPADRAGLRPGTLILNADGKRLLHPNDLIDAARASSGVLKLTIVEPRSNRKSQTEVDLSARR